MTDLNKARVLCTLAGASNLIDGVVFVDTSHGKCSARITDEQAAKFKRLPGFVDAPALDEADEADLDALIAEMTRAVDADATRATGNVPSADMERTIEEQNRAHAAMSAELDSVRLALDEANRKLAKSEVPALEAEVARLRKQLDNPDAGVSAMQEENGRLRASNETLTAELGKRDETISGLKAELADAQKQLKEAVRPMPTTQAVEKLKADIEVLTRQLEEATAPKP